jgi:hypothetical protein
MVRITNGEFETEVSIGAFNGIYKDLGFKRIVSEQDADFVDDEQEYSVNNADEVFVNELLEKPISEWNKQELKKFTDIKNINTTSAKNVAEAKEIVKEWLDENA